MPDLPSDFFYDLDPKCQTKTRSPCPAPTPDQIGPAGQPKMIYRPLGRTGLRVSAISYGSWLTFDWKTL